MEENIVCFRLQAKSLERGQVGAWILKYCNVLFWKTTQSLEMLEGCRVRDGGAIGQEILQMAFRDQVEVGTGGIRHSTSLPRVLGCWLELTGRTSTGACLNSQESCMRCILAVAWP
jgi:hypothetical protein